MEENVKEEVIYDSGERKIVLRQGYLYEITQAGERKLHAVKRPQEH
jgi:hypothetical protein